MIEESLRVLCKKKIESKSFGNKDIFVPHINDLIENFMLNIK